MKNVETVNSDKINSEHTYLLKSLSEFGLKPADWMLVQNDEKMYLIRNIIEPGFYFIGLVKANDGQRQWRSIHLAGL